MSKIVVVIVTYNGMRHDWIQNCLNSINESSLKPKVLVVDNQSSDKTVHFIKKNYPEIELIESQENLGFGRANNKGIEWAITHDFDFVFLLNQDAYVEKDTIKKLQNACLKQKDFALVSPIHLNGKGDALDREFSREISYNFCPNLYSDYVVGNVKDEIYPSDFICAAAWFIPIQTFKEVGGFSTTFFHYGEDNNFIQRIQFKNLKIGVYPFARIRHDRVRDDKWQYGDDAYINKRNLLIELSNPNKDLDVNDAIRHYMMDNVKSLFKFNFQRIKSNLKFIQYLNKEKSNIRKNKQISKTDNYAFLDVENATQPNETR